MRLDKFILRSFKDIWDYFRPSWEDDSQKFSYKRASQFIFMVLIARQVMNGIHDQWSFNAFLTLAVLFSLTAMVITVPQLLQAFKYYAKTKKTDYFEPGPESGGETPVKTITTTETTQPVESVPDSTKID